MIELTRLNSEKFFLNCELIETVESKPDTVITLRSGKLYIVSESPAEVLDMTIRYKQLLYKGLIQRSPAGEGPQE